MYNWITLLYTWNEHIVYQPFSNKKEKKNILEGIAKIFVFLSNMSP